MVDIELDDNKRLAVLVVTAVLLVFELLNMPGLMGGGSKLFLLPLIGLADYTNVPGSSGRNGAWLPETGFSSQDIIFFLLIAALGAVYWLTREDDLDWEALLADDDDDEE